MKIKQICSSHFKKRKFLTLRLNNFLYFLRKVYEFFSSSLKKKQNKTKQFLEIETLEKLHIFWETKPFQSEPKKIK